MHTHSVVVKGKGLSYSSHPASLCTLCKQLASPIGRMIIVLLYFAVTVTVAVSLDSSLGEVINHPCSVWTSPEVINGTFTGRCVCGADLHSIVLCDNKTNVHNVYIVLYHCMSFSEVYNKTVVGHCLYHFHSDSFGTHSQLQGDDHSNNTALCQYNKACLLDKCDKYEHQTGLMCTSCVEGYAYPVYSYSIECVECKDYKYNWLKYVAVAFLPLTVFYILIILFRISVTSGDMNGYVLVCQLIAAPICARVLGTRNSSTSFKIFVLVIAIWNLDFFRGIYSPFCLHPKLNTLQKLMLDYVIAIYPLFLIILTYIFVKLHNRYSVVVKLWSPFYKVFSLIRNNWDINNSLVSAFATFLLLSYVKILNVSFYALTPNTLYDQNGTQMPKIFLYYDGTYEYFGADHIPYALLALFMLLVFNVFPLLLLCLYPCRCFHRCLNYCRLQNLTFHIFMDTFTGCYKIQPQDYRYFAAIFLFVKLLTLTITAVTADFVLSCLYISITSIVMTACVANFRPYNRLLYTVLDTAMFASLSILCLCSSVEKGIEILEPLYVNIVRLTLALAGLLPPFYGVGYLIYIMVPNSCKRRITQILKIIFTRDTMASKKETDPIPYRLEHSDEYPPLLPHTVSINAIPTTGQV